jgi:hypothetical protein
MLSAAYGKKTSGAQNNSFLRHKYTEIKSKSIGNQNNFLHSSIAPYLIRMRVLRTATATEERQKTEHFHQSAKKASERKRLIPKRELRR